MACQIRRLTVGQYHILVNIDKQEWVDPHGLGLGAKQWEGQVGSEGSLADAMYVLTMTSPDSGGGDLPFTEISGRWCGDRVLIVGDYTNPDAVPGFTGADAIYQLATQSPDYKNITGEVRDAFTKIYEMVFVQENIGSHTFWKRTLV
jgi:hypothetical protein